MMYRILGCGVDLRYKAVPEHKRKITGPDRTLDPSKSNWPISGTPRIKRTYIMDGLASLILLGEQPTLTRLESRSDATKQNVFLGK
jgi:hypothetical protein